MLPKVNRLSKNIEFDKVKSKGSKVTGKSLMVLVVDRKDADPARFGIVVSKNVSKKAVYRNRVKRLIRESLKSVLIKVKVGCNIVIIARSNIVGLGFSEVNNDLEHVFRKARLI
jgi:ribonuclease P protein component